MEANTEKSISLTDSDVQTFLEGKKNQYTKRKTESYAFNGFNDSISYHFFHLITMKYQMDLPSYFVR